MKGKFALGTKLLKALNCMALVFVIQTANAACIWMFHQPEFPEEAKKYRRVK
ncbi:cyclic lactone autoinducer peptide [bacterium 1xD8-6]|nr:cyclic lactone autoinducer peptide [bacterium D16-36]RKI68975.1 cyclic lactone autoinducer peptide [bacterium 1xD8-6]